MDWPQFISQTFAVLSDTEGRRKSSGSKLKLFWEVFGSLFFVPPLVAFAPDPGTPANWCLSQALNKRGK